MDGKSCRIGYGSKAAVDLFWFASWLRLYLVGSRWKVGVVVKRERGGVTGVNESMINGGQLGEAMKRVSVIC